MDKKPKGASPKGVPPKGVPPKGVPPKAILFDFDGVLVDNEPIHLKMFQKVLAEEGVRLTRQDYYTKYLGMDDKGCFSAVLKAAGRPTSVAYLHLLTRRKTRCYKEFVAKHLKFLPGVKEFIQEASKNSCLGIVSGALREEILLILGLGGLKKYFSVIVSAEDVKNGKPNPEGYLLGLKKLSAFHKEKIFPRETLVVEDSLWGIEAAHRAGIKCLAVTTSYPASQLKKADWVVKELSQFLI
ncbi:MAG: HAD family phosphatase [Deltaproteobacteria bacterium]|nr:HAD family phosphatase [Deltaproteobacteria bacterium]